MSTAAARRLQFERCQSLVTAWLLQLLAGSLSFYKGQAAVEGLSKANLGTELRDFAVMCALYVPVRLANTRGSPRSTFGSCGGVPWSP